MSALNKDLFLIFSNPFQPTLDDVVAVGGVLESSILVYAYQHGVFPWPHEGYPMLWFAPEQRGVILFEQLHYPKSFKKWLRQNKQNYQIKLNSDFEKIILQCQKQKRKGQKGSWINKEIIKAYEDLNKKGFIISLGVYRDDKLVAGIYGVRSEKYISCESMFHLEDNTSKFALVSLVEHLKLNGYSWMDTQMVTSVCESFGGCYIDKAEFLKKIGFTQQM